MAPTSLTDHLLAWATLKSIPGIGNRTIRRLIDRFESPEAVLAADRRPLLEVDTMTPRLVAALRDPKLPDAVRADLETALEKGYRIVPLTDPMYPVLLRQIPDPPPYLYVCGAFEADSPTIAVVGSRHATGYGLTTTRRLCTDLARLGLVVVSGMARGIDTAAHRGALDGGGRTVAVLGSGLDRIYPAENRELFHRIADNGAVVTEFPLTTGPDAFNFPVRNRIISGMSMGTIIVEATRRSGSLITARLAAEQGRDVFAVPGSVQSFKSTGTHALIKQGAKLVEHAQDVLDELRHLLPADRAPAAAVEIRAPELTDAEQRVYEALEPYPVHIDDLVRKLAMEPGKLAGVLLNLELKGLIDQAPGKRFSIKGTP